MPQMILKTTVDGSVPEVYDRFGPDLLLQLSPPGMKVTIHEMSYPIELDTDVVIEVSILGIIKQHWHNRITEVIKTDDSCHFVDEGLKLPGMFKSWRHVHRICVGTDGKTQIVDDVTYTSPNNLLGWLFFPAVYLQFAYRKPKYKAFFKSKN
jgi:ligand-binding SRPBCC domain-containing protein